MMKGIPKGWLLLAIAIATRALVVGLEFPGFPPGWGGEMAAVAQSIATGHGFASPYVIATGPTALVPPVYPYLLSVLFALFAPNAIAAGIVSLALNVVLSSLVLIPLYSLTASLWTEKAGVVVAWTWALLPVTGYTDALFIWNTSLYTLVLTTFLALTLLLHPNATRRKLLLYSALTSFLIVTEPVSLTIVGVAFLWLCARRLPVKHLILIAATAAILPGAWAVRNLVTFRRPVFLRSGFGLELSSGIRSYELVGDAPASLPNRNAAELERYRTLGELGYFQHRYEDAAGWIRSHPAEYRRRVVKRAVAFWTGYAVEEIYLFHGRYGLIKRLLFAMPALGGFVGLFFVARRTRILVLGTFMIYPVVYYFTHIELRQRLPIEPLLFALTVGAAFQALEWAKGLTAVSRLVAPRQPA